MGRNRTQICPHGHNKDAPNGSYWSRRRTYKGTWTNTRLCAECMRLRDKAKPFLKLYENKPRDPKLASYTCQSYS